MARDLIITWTGILRAASVLFVNSSVGVNPSKDKWLHNSILSAHFDSADKASEKVSTQTSIKGFFIV